MSKFFFSIIIPTYKRNHKLEKIIDQLVSQCPSTLYAEIIVISNSKLNLNINFSEITKKKIKLKLLTVKKNSNAIKRNKGIKTAKGKYLILIDDDCYPHEKFLNNYLKLFQKVNDNEILCGSVKYLKPNIKNENFIRYRQSRHFIEKNYIDRKKNLPASNIVTMNMGMKNSKLLEKTNYFNKNFGGYGFEDYEFGYRLIKDGFKFIKSSPTIYHLDERNYRSYLNKIYFLSKYSAKTLKKINYSSWKNTIYFKIENNLLINFFKKIKFIHSLIALVEKFVVFIERNIFLSPKTL